MALYTTSTATLLTLPIHLSCPPPTPKLRCNETAKEDRHNGTITESGREREESIDRYPPKRGNTDPNTLLTTAGRSQIAAVEVEAAVVGLAHEVVVKLGPVEAADLELVRQEQLRRGQPDARRAARHGRHLAEPERVDAHVGLDEQRVWGCVVEHPVCLSVCLCFSLCRLLLAVVCLCIRSAALLDLTCSLPRPGLFCFDWIHKPGSWDRGKWPKIIDWGRSCLRRGGKR